VTATTRRGLLLAAVGGTGGGGLAAALHTQLLLLSCDEAVLSGSSLSGSESAHALVTTLRDHAVAHVAALRGAGARGGISVLSPGPALDRALVQQRITGRPGRLRGERDALNLLLDVERIAIGAAYVALGTVTDPDVSLLLAQLMASGAQHEAVLHEALHPGDIVGAIRYGIVQGTQA
jgi:fermentation-respiration switch protein FrsA (DUF1100 family)